MASEIAQYLQATLSSDPNVRISAELKLSELSAQPDSGLSLAQIVLTQDAELPLRQMSTHHSAGILLRKYIKERWSPFFSQFRGNPPPTETKAQIRQAVFQGLSDPVRKIRSLCAQVLSSIADADWPDEYPELLTSLINLLSSGSTDSVHGAMQVFVEFVDGDLSEDQILPVLRQLLPALLHILGTGDSHSPLTRARTVVVFKQCVEALYMVKDQHPQAVKEATASVLPVWLDAFRVLLTIDPREDVANAHWDGLSIKIEIFKTLDTLLTSFPRAVTPYVPDVLDAALVHLTTLLPFFTRYYLDAAESIPRNSEDGTTELTTLAGTIFDFISRAARGSRAKEWFSDTNLTAIVNVVFAWVQMTSDDEEQWGSDPNAFIAQDSEETLQYSTRVAGSDVLGVLLDRSPAVTVAAMGAVTRHIVEESSRNRSAGQPNWWRPLEAAFSALGSNTEPVLDTLEDEVDAGRAKPIDVEWLLRDVVPALLVLSEFPFLQGRSFVLASQFSKLLPSELASQYLDASVQVLEASEAGVPVKISAIKAIQNFYQHITSPIKQTLAPRIAQDLKPFITQTSEDTLNLVLETLASILLVNEGVWITPELTSSVLESILEVWTKFNRDPLFISVLGEVFGSLVSSKTQVGYEIVMRQAVPVFCNAILTSTNDSAWFADAALDLLDSIIGARGDLDLGDGFFATIAPALFYALANAEDRDVIQNGISVLTLIIRKVFNQVHAWSHPTTGKSGLEHVLAVIAKQLQGEDESGGLFIGDLIIHLLRVAGDAVLPVLPELLQAMAGRMLTAKTATFVQSLIIPFAFLIHHGQRDTVLTLLESTNVNGRSALDIVINTWCENAETIQGFWAARISILGLCQLYVSERSSLQQLIVKGDIIVKEETKDVIMTRSRTKKSTKPPKVPTEFTRVPFPVKALKLILHDLTSGGDSAGMGPDGDDVASDDGDDTWEDDGAEEGILNKEEMTYLSELLGPRGTAFDNDTGLDIDDDDLKADPVSQLDLKAHIIGFLRECASRNVNNFSSLIDQLDAEETLVVRKALSEQ